MGVGGHDIALGIAGVNGGGGGAGKGNVFGDAVAGGIVVKGYFIAAGFFYFSYFAVCIPANVGDVFGIVAYEVADGIVLVIVVGVVYLIYRTAVVVNVGGGCGGGNVVVEMQ